MKAKFRINFGQNDGWRINIGLPVTMYSFVTKTTGSNVQSVDFDDDNDILTDFVYIMFSELISLVKTHQIRSLLKQ